MVTFSFILIHGIGSPAAFSSEKAKQVVGWIEYVTILPENQKIKAKMDLASILIVVIGMMAILSVLTNKLGLARAISVALFPMVI
jgi:hypothetical protein